MPRLTLATTALTAAAILTIAGCSSDTEDDTTAASVSPPAASVAMSTTATTGSDTSAQFSQDMQDNYGTTQWWPVIVDTKIDGANAVVTAQIDRNQDKDIADHIERSTVNLMTNNDGFSDVDWVIVEDGAGTVITQKQVPD
ncbi:hypothetical protein [Gordonia sp. DT101]|uniref:hypothetical protein n=1 Tax=Gordonia sp. DT101 TaxID=3416545 RepID=UPI003CF1E78F